jgi:hypothetical protein
MAITIADKLYRAADVDLIAAWCSAQKLVQAMRALPYRLTSLMELRLQKPHGFQLYYQPPSSI